MAAGIACRSILRFHFHRDVAKYSAFLLAAMGILGIGSRYDDVVR